MRRAELRNYCHIFLDDAITLAAPISLQNDFLSMYRSRAWSLCHTRPGTRYKYYIMATWANYSGRVIANALNIATKELDYSELRLNQEAVMTHFMRGRDVFASLLICKWEVS